MRALALGIVATIMLAGCSTGDEPRSEPAAGDEALTEAVQGVCSARDAVAGAIQPAWRIFQDEAHDTLHELARQVTDRSREAAAALLEAKQRVEVAFVKDMNANGFRKLMSELLDASNAALEELSLTPVECA